MMDFELRCARVALAFIAAVSLVFILATWGVVCLIT